MKTIVGLGNPGQTYHGTRHNVGFALIQQLIDRHGVKLQHRLVNPTDERPAAVYGDYAVGGESVRLMMPLTMMNESGEALSATAVDLQHLLVVCDDVNLPLGVIRVRPGGSSGGHHGLQSCLEVLKTEDLPRLRIGVGTPQMPRDLQEFVLSQFNREERPLIRQAIEQAADACEMWVTDGMAVAMNRYNQASQE